MAETVLLAFLLAKKKGYKVKPLFKSWTIYPLIVFQIIYLIEQAIIFSGNYEYVGFIRRLEPVYLGLHLLLILKYEIYISSIIGVVSMLFGGLLNNIAIKANGGFMPAYPTLSYLTGYVKPDTFSLVKDIHMLGNSQTNLKILTDFIDVGYSILSIGDVFIRVFVFIVIYNSIKKINNLASKGEMTCYN
ncbi:MULTISPECIES: DUF5317 family protein [unclassified Clostridium]|uniref:DUF5317 family protein n=1 Tax=unclassified Clostridium TaxID=2614128 RepID=UPI0002982413|nr:MULTISPECIES: DUF5317 family protein [unclassified Clostridium]EKQ51719.1 MAG: hypothetical protein A370_04704 [Clostridium sp. Maddingley MBC34-26]